MTTYYLDTNSGFFYKIIDGTTTCSIEAWSSKNGPNGQIAGLTTNLNGISSTYAVTKITSISKTSSDNFPGFGNTVKSTGGDTLVPGSYTVSPFTGTTLTIPISVTTIDSGAFSACSSLTSIIYSGDLTSAVGSTGTNPLIQYAETGMTTFVKYFKRGSIETSYTIPSGITTINASAFDEPQLTSIIYQGDLTSSAVGSTGNSPLIQYNGPNMKTLKKYFQRGSTETTFKSNDYTTIETISDSAFTSVSYLVKIVINSNITIAKYAFFNCSSLKGIVISSPCTLQQSIIIGSTLDYVLISSTSPVTMGNSNPPSDSSPIFPSSILASTNYCVVSNENRTNVDTLFGTSNIVYIEDATNPPATDTQTRVYIRPATYNSIKTTLVGESNDIASIQTSIDFDNQEAKLLKAIQAKVRAINAAITDITGEQAINNRKINYFGQDKYVNMYVNRIGLILYYIVFILLALSFYYNRESYSIVMIVISLIVFALLPFVIKYITRFAYEQFLGLLKVFYKGNALYLDP